MYPIRWSGTNPTPYDELQLTFLNPIKDPTSDTESIPSPSTSPVLVRRHYGESITNLGKASILGETVSHLRGTTPHTWFQHDFFEVSTRDSVKIIL